MIAYERPNKLEGDEWKYVLRWLSFLSTRRKPLKPHAKQSLGKRKTSMDTGTIKLVWHVTDCMLRFEKNASVERTKV